jgi:D-alanyl-D-alanine carboxypeptidase
MNALARELGLHESYFLNPSGLDVSTSLSGGYGSARDVAMLVAHILSSDPHLLEATSFNTLAISSKSAVHKVVNTDKALDAIPNVLASKTGFTDLSGGNLVVAFDAGLGHTVIIALLGSSYDGRFEDMKRLVDETVRYLGDL